MLEILAVALLPTLVWGCYVCNCTLRTTDCEVCLAYSFRDYSCGCLRGFVEATPTNYYCVPQNCTKSAFFGCVECASNMQVKFSELQRVVVCVCKPNYEYDADLGDCLCKSHFLANLYYQNGSQCLECPEGCVCDGSGCSKCEEAAHRQVRLHGPSNICPCLPPLTDVDGVCQCFQDCECFGDGSISCSPVSRRVRALNGSWICTFPFSEGGGRCNCVSPF